jgi:phenylacetate-CoA ligase
LTAISILPAALGTLQRLEKLQWKNLTSLRSMQERRMRQMIGYASANVPFYRRLFHEQHIGPNAIRTPEDLPRLPTISRRDVVRNFRDMSVPSLSGGRSELVGSSGSSGPPVYCRIDQMTIHESIATILLFNLWASWLPGTPIVQIMRQRPLRISQRIFWQVLMRSSFLDSLQITNSTASSYADLIASSRPSLIVSYPSVLGMIARNTKEPPSSVRGIVVGSETMTPNVANDIEKGFSRRAFNRYGLSEFGGALMQDCCLHQGLHLNPELAVVEVVDTHGEQVTEGERGRLVITALRNFVMPLIRYEVGDVGIQGGQCACGRGFPVISGVVGRTSDLVVGKDGDEVSAFLLLNALHYYDYFPELIREFQFVDRGRGLVTLRIVPSEHFLENQARNGEHIESRLHSTLPMLEFTVEATDELRREASGKQSLVIRE